jgi:hypothetical protein
MLLFAPAFYVRSIARAQPGFVSTRKLIAGRDTSIPEIRAVPIRIHRVDRHHETEARAIGSPELFARSTKASSEHDAGMCTWHLGT